MLRKQDVLMLTFMVNLVVLSLSTHKEAHHPETWMLLPRAQLSRRSGATVPSRESELVRSSSFPKKSNEEVSDWYHASKYRLFATFARLFSSTRASSPRLPSFASRKDCSTWTDDRSRPRVADPASISTISE